VHNQCLSLTVHKGKKNLYNRVVLQYNGQKKCYFAFPLRNTNLVDIFFMEATSTTLKINYHETLEYPTHTMQIIKLFIHSQGYI